MNWDITFYWLINEVLGNSEGKYITLGVKERYDCLSWCEYVENNFPQIDEIILSGISMGATTILLATGLKLPSKVKGLIADCGFTSTKDIISQVLSAKYSFCAEMLLPIINILCLSFARFNIYDCSAVDVLKQNKLPVLFIHGVSDDFVPSRMSIQNYEACRGPKKLLLIECATHGLSYLADKVKIQKEIKDFLAEV